MKYREFMYVGDTVSMLSKQENTALVVQIQKNVLTYLVRQEVLNRSQYESCISEIERQAKKQSHKCS